jgi:23S rRNA pseudouridine1911/1915/1917 synthase
LPGDKREGNAVSDSSARLRRFEAGAEDAGERLDRWLATQIPEISRTQIQEHIRTGSVRVSGHTARASQRIEAGDTIEIRLPAPTEIAALAEPIPLDVLYEDNDLLAINKPAGMVVHPGAGVRRGTVANALLGRYGQLSTLGGPARPGIVHRLDKETSGVLLAARTDEAHRNLVRALAARRVEKTYLALVHGHLERETGQIDLPIARDLRRRTRMTTRRREGRAALTTWQVLLRLGPAGATQKSASEEFTLIEAGLHTGRTHQIRVHFSAVGHPVAGDTRYGAPARVRIGAETLEPLGRLWLHAARVRLAHPQTGHPLEIRAPLAPELRDWLRALGKKTGDGEATIDRVLQRFL